MSILTDAADRSTQGRNKILITISGDGFVKVYADHRTRTDVVIANIPYAGHTAKAELLGEEYLDLTLPRWAQELHWPGNLRATGNAKPLLATDVEGAIAVEQFAEALRNLAFKDDKRGAA